MKRNKGNTTKLDIYRKEFFEISKQLKISEAYKLTEDFLNEPKKFREALETLCRAEKVHLSALAEVINILDYQEKYK